MDGQQPNEEQTGAPTQFAPGDTIRPQQQSAELPQPQSTPTQVELPQPTAPQQPAQQTVTPPPAPQPPVSTQPDTPAAAPTPAEYDNPQFAIPASAEAQSSPSGDVVSWTASEFIAHNKTGGWYALIILAACVAAVLVWMLTKDFVSAAVVVLAGIVLAVYAGRQPRQLSYQIDPSGLTIDQRHYSFNDFRSFTVVPEGAFSSIVFTPLKRFGAWTTIYYDPQDEDTIVDLVSQRLPHEERKPDAIDSMMRRIRF